MKPAAPVTATVPALGTGAIAGASRAAVLSPQTSRRGPVMETGIKVEGVGHVVLKVSDVERSLGFYRDALGLIEVAQMDLGNAPMVFLSTGSNHHDVALLEV